MLGFEDLALSMRVTVVVLPVAFYFLVLGLLNSRPHPQLLSGRRDFALLVGAFCPLGLLPLADQLGQSPLSVVAAAAVLGGAVCLLAPRGASWVIYNLRPGQARDVIGRALAHMGLSAREEGGDLRIGSSAVILKIRAFPLLRNVSVRLVDSCDSLNRRFERALARTLSQQQAQTSPATAALLLVAAAMMVVPLTLVAGRAGEIVRILGDLLK